MLFVDALRLSAEMATISLRNLENLLTRIVSDETADPASLVVEAVVCAYGIIDAANRFREVLRTFPGLKQNSVFKLFIKKTADVEALRDIHQHLNREMENIGKRHAAALGTLTWIGPSPAPDSPPTAWVLQPGSFYPGQFAMGPKIDLEAREPRGRISQMRLVTSGIQVDLSAVVNEILDMTKSLEPSIRESATGKELLASDIWVHFALKPLPPK